MKKSIFKASFEESLNLEDDGFLQYQLKEQNKKVSNPPSNIFGYFKNGFAYKVIKSENGMITNGRELLDLESEFIPVGKSVYEDLYIPSKWSINGKNQKIVSYDEIQEYYNGEIEKRSLVS